MTSAGWTARPRSTRSCFTSRRRARPESCWRLPAAERRFGVRWQVLAAVNLVESAFGRVVNRSSAGAQGPMQFLPATWREYGLGGNVHVPRDAILGAANYLHRSGAPADEHAALHAYNPSNLYVDAVLAYAGAMTRDPLAYLTYYTWEASLPSTLGR